LLRALQYCWGVARIVIENSYEHLAYPSQRRFVRRPRTAPGTESLRACLHAQGMCNATQHAPEALTTQGSGGGGGAHLCTLDDDVMRHILQRLHDGMFAVAMSCARLRDAVHEHLGTHRIESDSSHVCATL
jgi:hypothetical protein